MLLQYKNIRKESTERQLFYNGDTLHILEGDPLPCGM